MRPACCALVALVALWVTAIASTASAQAPLCEPGALRVTVLPHTEPPDTVLTARVEEHLRAALAARGIALCPARAGDDTGIGVVRWRLVHTPEGSTVLTIEVGDALTRKRVERTTDLSSVPADGRSLAIAVSADELLRASWAELALSGATHDARAVPPAVLSAVSPAPAPAPAPRSSGSLLELGLEAGGSLQPYRSALSLRVHAASWLGPRVGVRAALGASFGERREARHGAVRADALALELGPAFAPFTIAAPLGVSLEAALAVARLSFVATANESGEASSFDDWSLTAHGRARAWLGSEWLRATLMLGGLLPIRPTDARDEGRVVTSSRGAGAEGSLGVALLF